LRCLCIAALLIVLGAGTAHAQTVAVQYFPCDAERPIDMASPALRDVLLTYGIVPDPEAEGGVLPQIMGQLREKAPKILAFGVRLTNDSAAAIPVTPQAVCLQEGTWKDAGPDFGKAKPLPASDVTAWSGAHSLFAKGATLAPHQSVTGVVYFEVPADQAQPEPPRRVAYVVPQGVNAKAGEPAMVAALLDDLGLEWVATASAGAPAPPSGKPRVFPAAGNTDDSTPLVLPQPAAVVWKTTVVVASKNIVAEQTQQSASGMGGGMMGGGMMGGGMPGMMGGGGQMGSGMMGGGGNQGGSTLPGMGGAPGAGAATGPRPSAAGGAAKPSTTQPTTAGRRPRKPGGS
jgi:hypothetical protein